ncbi:uncharacterized protein EI97DRAFT_41326 [Westerdykella ornata]|uniref:Uncharacterized protein n=1 Tax=Westerdykella ornata TaxID=318751 RepID=A0A6A6JNJ4_WESOR|nr:uncharacterized protein EI97DRAFT_41326 [Westerdykella ornata]KAF2276489.1 hypothetical protein EI97DRAFT_41326 [Westerdykella ornata]
MVTKARTRRQQRATSGFRYNSALGCPSLFDNSQTVLFPLSFSLHIFPFSCFRPLIRKDLVMFGKRICVAFRWRGGGFRLVIPGGWMDGGARLALGVGAGHTKWDTWWALSLIFWIASIWDGGWSPGCPARASFFTFFLFFRSLPSSSWRC